MLLTIDAVYADGVLKPLTPLNLVENQQVTIQVVLPEPTQSPAAPAESALEHVGPAEFGEDVAATIVDIRSQTQTKIERLHGAQMPAPESITIKGLWSHVDPTELEQALAEVREQTNRRLQRLLDEI